MKYDLAELVAGITPENRHPLVDFGPSKSAKTSSYETTLALGIEVLGSEKNAEKWSEKKFGRCLQHAVEDFGQAPEESLLRIRHGVFE